jgi:Ca2+-binding EF-hand superfamily protein
VKKTRQRQGRALFLTYICGSFAAVLMAAPLLNSLSSASASAGASRRPLPTFEQADRNQDGYVSRFESRAVRGLVESFERADRNGDGRIDKVEYARALADLETNP